MALSGSDFLEFLGLQKLIISTSYESGVYCQCPHPSLLD
jgi:hypothetical protein